MDPKKIAALEVERMRRIKAGVPRSEADLSDLVNEAVRQTFGPQKTALRKALAQSER